MHLQPASLTTLVREVEALLLNGSTAEALITIQAIEDTAGNHTEALKKAAELFVHCGQHEAAHRCQNKAKAIDDRDPETLFGLAASSLALGKIDQAEALYDRLIYLNPNDHDAWYNRSTLRRQTSEDNHVQQLIFVFGNLPDNHPGRVPIAYALAKELEDLERFDESFSYLQTGAAERRGRLSYNVEQDEEMHQAIAARHTQTWLNEGQAGYNSAQPIFVLGLPRSGTTLVERIISAHSQVVSRGETSALPMTLNRLGGQQQDRMALLDATSNVDPALIGEAYCSSLAGLGDDSPRLLDKTPLNFLYLGLIRRALPNARIIHLKRNAMDSCYAMYKTLFRMGYPFSYSLQDVGRYTMSYHDLMSHWRRIMPDTILDVDYEQLVSDTEHQVNRMLEFLALPFEPECLEFHRQKAPSATASAAQVRQPIYSSSVNRWKCYERQLGPLAAKMKAHGITVD